MIIAQNIRHVEKSGDIGAEQKFSIKASRQAFEVLSSGMYSNKILAWIRETFCNAYDAHIAANSLSTPIEVHIPSALEPWFSVKDYGTGMSDENVFRLYTTYFESTKGDTNNQIGGLGLGSKAGFCYSDSFTVISRFEGVKRVYTAFLNDEGMPAIARQSEEATDEPNGMEVSGAVQLKDIHSFVSNAKAFFARVFPSPSFSGNFKTVEPIKYQEFQGKGWRVRESGDEDDEAKVIMGIVAYPLDVDASRLTPEQNAVRRLPLDIDFNIGEIDVAASREKLSFNAKSINIIAKRLNEIQEEITSKIREEFANCQNMWDAKILLNKLISGKYQAFSSVVSQAGGVRWRDRPIWAKAISVEHEYFIQSLQFLTSDNGKVCSEKIKKEISACPCEFYFNDVKSGGVSRARYFVKTNPDKVILLFKFEEERLADFIKLLGIEGAEIKRASELPRPPRGISGVTEKGKSPVLMLNLPCYYNDDGSNWSLPEDDFDIEDGGIYVEVKRNQIREIKPSQYWKTLAKAKAVGVNLEDLDVYGLKSGVVNQARTSGKWIHLEDYIKQELSKKLKVRPKLPSLILDMKELDSLKDEEEDLATIFAFIAENFECDFVKEFAEYKEKLTKIITKEPDLRSWKEAIDAFQIALPQVKSTYGFHDKLEEFKNNHPALAIALWALKESWCNRYVVSENRALLLKALEKEGLIKREKE